MSKTIIKTRKKGENFKSPNNIPKILLVGYNGANNTGSEARLISIIEDVKTVLGSEVQITVPTLNEKNLRRYLNEGPGLRIAPIPSIFFYSIRKLVKEHDLILLVEGSCYMDTWTSALLWAFLWATRCAYSSRIPCIAYAVDSGKLSRFNKYLVKREASKTDLIITRTNSAKERLENIGVTAPMKVTADCAFTFKTNEHTLNNLHESGLQTGNGVVGLAVVDFHLWPVVIRPWGKKEYLYKWPYYFSRSKMRLAKSEDLASGWAEEADRIISEYDKNIALICMEEVDEPLANSILDKMKYSSKVRIFSSSQFNAKQMTHILRSLDLLMTSRYHAGILSLEELIPQIAVGHDTRLKGFYEELGLIDYLIDYTPDVWRILRSKVDELMKIPDKNYEVLKQGYHDHYLRSLENRMLLKEFLDERGWNSWLKTVK
jgi:polysaccharide pyruvyl transferase WcaK-like protein